MTIRPRRAPGFARATLASLFLAAAAHLPATPAAAVPATAGGAWARTTPMTLVRTGHGATLLASGRQVLVDTCVTCSDVRGLGFQSEVFETGAAGLPTWRSTGMPQAADPPINVGGRIVPGRITRGGHTSTLLADGTVLMAGGTRQYPGRPEDALAASEVYDPAAQATVTVNQRPVQGAWKLTGQMADARFDHGAALLAGGEVLVTGGRQSDVAALRSTELYNPGAGSWSTAAPLRQARAEHTTTVLDPPACATASPPAGYPCGSVLVVGGRQGTAGALASAERYDPAADTWTDVYSLSEPRADHTATLLHDGRVLVAGGREENSPRPSAEVYDPVHDAWKAVERLDVSRVGHSATLLTDGTVLVAGGTTVLDPQVVASTEVFDPTDGSWTQAESLEIGRTAHSATRLGDGTVLVAGGSSSTAASAVPGMTSAEVFDPLGPVPRVQLVSPPDGPTAGGTQVTISGRHLGGATAVMFGARPATAVTQLDESTVIATSPAAPPGVVDVTVTTPLGMSPISVASPFTYQPGGWTETDRLDACDDGTGRVCNGRSDQVSVVLDPPSCRATSPPDGYPCGRVFVAGRMDRTFDDGVINEDGTVSSAKAKFTPDDVGSVISSHIGSFDIPFGTTISAVVEDSDGTRARLSPPLGFIPIAPSHVFIISHANAEIYDPVNGKWSPVRRMGTQRAVPPFMVLPSFTATLLADGRVLVVGGCCLEGSSRDARPTAEIYDPTTDEWKPVEDRMEVGRYGHTATLLRDGRVLVVGGVERSGDLLFSLPVTTPSAEIYDPVTNAWTPAAAPGVKRVAHTASLLPSGDVLVVGGFETGGEHAHASAQLYHPDQGLGRWSHTGSLNEARVLHSATVLDPPACASGQPVPGYPCGGKILVAGGANSVGRTFDVDRGKVSVELYDVVTGAWTTAGFLRQGRATHTATPLPDGTVLFTGGWGADSSTEIFDPAAPDGNSLVTRPMSIRRVTHTATLLDAPPCGQRCGQVLVAGGYKDNGELEPTTLATSELFTPAPYVGGVEPSAGPSSGGTIVVLTGAALAGASGVSFGGAAAGFTVESPSRIVATAPAHPAGTAAVEVTSPLWPRGTGPPGRAPPFTFGTSGAPSRVGDLTAVATSDTEVTLRFSAPASDGSLPPPAGRYLVKQSLSPLTGDAAFDAAPALCGGTCVRSPGVVGALLSLTVTDLDPGTTYHYALRAVGPTGMIGPISNPASATTGGTPPVRGCPALPTAGPGQVAYPGGYSLVGLPERTPPPTESTLFGWFDQGAGGRYSLRDALSPGPPGQAWWSWSRCPRLVTVVGPGRDRMSVPLGPYRASLVGNPSATGAVTVSGQDYAARWVPGLNNGAGGYAVSRFREPVSLAVGEGIWVFSFTATTVTMAR